MSIQSQIDALEKLSALDAELKDLSDVLRKDRGELDGKRTRLAELVERQDRRARLSFTEGRASCRRHARDFAQGGATRA